MQTRVFARCRRGLIFVFLIAAGCASSPPRAQPTQLNALAAQFKADASTNRVVLGKKITALMPAAPGGHANGGLKHWLSFGEDESIDWDHPSYQLPKDDLIAALGTPDHVRSFNIVKQWDFLFWRVGRDRHDDECGLYIHCYNGHVVGGFVTETNTVQSISTRTNAGGSVTVKTNYIE
jgi:hypothetical protein